MALVPLAALSLAACGTFGPSGPRSPASWNEESLCRQPWERLVDGEGLPVKDARVWTEARMREGAAAFGESMGGDVLRRGPASRSDAEGLVVVCDVTAPLIRTYGERGTDSIGMFGRSWSSVLAVDLFVEVDGPNATTFFHARRFTSPRWGEGRVVPLGARVMVPLASEAAVLRPRPVTERVNGDF